MREIETLPEEAAVQALDFVLFLRTKAKSNHDGLKNSSHAENFRKIPREDLYDRF